MEITNEHTKRLLRLSANYDGMMVHVLRVHNLLSTLMLIRSDADKNVDTLIIETSLSNVISTKYLWTTFIIKRLENQNFFKYLGASKPMVLN